MIWGAERNSNTGGQKYNHCKICKTKDKPHYSKGLCYSCYEKQRRDYKAKYWRENYGKERSNKFLRSGQLKKLGKRLKRFWK